MLKFGNFSATQILREINFSKSEVSKYAILTVLSFNEFLHFTRTEITKNQNQEPLKRQKKRF